MERKKSWKKSLALALAAVFMLPVIAIIVSACGDKVYHKVTFYSDDRQTVLGYVKVEDGKEAKFRTPTKESGKKLYFEFVNWVDEEGNVADLTEVKEDMVVYATFVEKYVPYHLTKPAQVTVVREGDALQDGAEIHYDDKLRISYTASAGYVVTTFQVNGEDFTSGNNFVVKGNVEIVYREERQLVVEFLGPNGEVLVEQKIGESGKAEAINPDCGEYRLLQWDFDFNKTVTQYTQIQGIFVKESEKIDGVTATAFSAGEYDAGGISLTLSQECEVYTLLQEYVSNYMEQEVTLPTTLTCSFSIPEQNVDNWGKLEWGDVPYETLWTFTGEGEPFTEGFSIWAGVFVFPSNVDIEQEMTGDAMMVSTFNVKASNLGFDNLFFVVQADESVAEDISSMKCSFYKHIYGIKDRPEVKGVDRIEGISLTRPQRMAINEQEEWITEVEKDSAIHNVMKEQWGMEEVPTTLKLTVTEIADVDEYDRQYYGDGIDWTILLSVKDTEETLWVGWYEYYELDIIVLDAVGWGLDVSRIYVLYDETAQKYFFYKSFSCIDLVETA